MKSAFSASSHPLWVLVPTLGFGPRHVALRILQELGLLPSREDEDRCGCSVWPVDSCVVGNRQLLDLGVLGTLWALSVLGRWCRCSMLLPDWLAGTGDEVGLGPTESGLRSMPRNWSVSFQWNN